MLGWLGYFSKTMSLARELLFIILLKLILLVVLWVLFFAHPLDEQSSIHFLERHVFHSTQVGFYDRP